MIFGRVYESSLEGLTLDSAKIESKKNPATKKIVKLENNIINKSPYDENQYLIYRFEIINQKKAISFFFAGVS